MHDQVRSFQEIRNEINQTCVELLLTDADTGLTFLAIAERTQNQETMQRNIRNARKAYESIRHLRTKYIFSQVETETLERRLLEIRRRLEALGQAFPD